MWLKFPKNFVFETPTSTDWIYFFLGVLLNKKIWILEPYNAYHHNDKRTNRYFPAKIPSVAKRYLQSGKAELIEFSQMNMVDTYYCSENWGVFAAKLLFESLSNKKKFLRILSDIMGDDKAVKGAYLAFLGSRLSEYYSFQTMLSKVHEHIGSDDFLFFPRRRIADYDYLRKLARGVEDDSLHKTAFSKNLLDVPVIMRKFQEWCLMLGHIILRICLGSYQRVFRKQYLKKRTYPYAVLDVSKRQYYDTQRGFDFIADEKLIFKKDILVLTQGKLNAKNKQFLQDKGMDYYVIDKKDSCRGAARAWIKFFAQGLIGTDVTLTEFKSASLLLDSYFRWKSVVDEVDIENLIIHANFAEPHIGRKAALSAGGVETWYYADSNNNPSAFIGCFNYGKGDQPHLLSLSYDHLMAWTEFMAEKFSRHTDQIGKIHIIGCLWSDHVREFIEKKEYSAVFKKYKTSSNFIVAAFDSTYTYNGITSYEEGIVFVEHLLRLVSEDSRVVVFLKRKKDHKGHLNLGFDKAEKLNALLDEMEGHPRVVFIGPNLDTSQVIADADLIISFPFTSPSLEAISAGKKAFWHDPMGYYHNAPFSRAGYVSHSFDELYAKFNEYCINGQSLPEVSSSFKKYFDTYGDARALQRFRTLLSGKEEHAGIG